MADATSQASWIDRLRSRKSRQQTDWADLGTAYGLDLSMEPTPAADPASAVTPPGAPARRWWQRSTRKTNASHSR
jgi:hypothetical protein